MSDYVLPEKRATIDLSDVGLPGGEVTVSLRLPMALFEQFGTTSEHTLPMLRDLFVKWALRGWNLADAAGPLPPTVEGMDRLEVKEQWAIITAYLNGVVNPPAPLSPPSGSGEPSPEP